MPIRVQLFLYLVIAEFVINTAWAVPTASYVAEHYGLVVLLGTPVLGLVYVLAAWLVVYRKQGWLRWLIVIPFLLRNLDIAWGKPVLRLIFDDLLVAALSVAIALCAASGEMRAWLAETSQGNDGARVPSRLGGAFCGLVLGYFLLTSLFARAVVLFGS